MKMGVLAGAAALAVSGFASAGFVGMDVQSSVIDGKTVFQVFAKFNNANDVVLSVFGVNGIPAGGFFNNDFAGGSWAPQFTNPAAITTDSFVTIGGTPGFTNSTQADPNWGGSGFTQPGIPNNAGWFNSNPPNLQGKVNAGTLSTLIAQFSFAGTVPTFTSPITVSFNQGLGTPTQFATSSFTVPAPGAVALLGLAGLAGRRRRA
jgi:MYXO-CTERM domain-containing protein